MNRAESQTSRSVQSITAKELGGEEGGGLAGRPQGSWQQGRYER